MGKKSAKSRKHKGGELVTAAVVGIPHVVNAIGSCIMGAGHWLSGISVGSVGSAIVAAPGALVSAATAAPGVIASGVSAAPGVIASGVSAVPGVLAATPGTLQAASVGLMHTTVGVFQAAPGVLSSAGQGLIAGGTAFANVAYAAGGIAMVAGLATLAIESISNFFIIVSEFEKDGHIPLQPQVKAYILDEPTGENNTFKSIAEREQFVKKLVSILYMKMYITDQCAAVYLEKLKQISEENGVEVDIDNLVPTFQQSTVLDETLDIVNNAFGLKEGALDSEKINRILMESLENKQKKSTSVQKLLTKVEENVDKNREGNVTAIDDLETTESRGGGGRRRRRRRRRTKKI